MLRCVTLDLDLLGLSRPNQMALETEWAVLWSIYLGINLIINYLIYEENKNSPLIKNLVDYYT